MSCATPWPSSPSSAAPSPCEHMNVPCQFGSNVFMAQAIFAQGSRPAQGTTLILALQVGAPQSIVGPSRRACLAVVRRLLKRHHDSETTALTIVSRRARARASARFPNYEGFAPKKLARHLFRSAELIVLRGACFASYAGGPQQRGCMRGSPLHRIVCALDL